ncbi:MAG: hypothetical protein AB7O13_03435 [Alphaproteobacteria bacterium]
MEISYPPVEDVTDEALQRMNISRDDYARMRAERVERERQAPAVGAPAPDFTVERLSSTGKRTGAMFQLSSAQGRPVALIFGSYT